MFQYPTHLAIEPVGVIGIDQGHGPLAELEPFNQRFIGLCDHVDDCVANADNV